MWKYKMIKREYSPTKSGKNWSTVQDCMETKIVDEQFYKNYVDSIPFFNNFGYGAYCRGFREYTKAGNIITKVVTVSPGRDKKIVTRFYLIDEEESA